MSKEWANNPSCNYIVRDFNKQTCKFLEFSLNNEYSDHDTYEKVDKIITEPPKDCGFLKNPRRYADITRKSYSVNQANPKSRDCVNDKCSTLVASNTVNAFSICKQDSNCTGFLCRKSSNPNLSDHNIL